MVVLGGLKFLELVSQVPEYETQSLPAFLPRRVQCVGFGAWGRETP